MKMLIIPVAMTLLGTGAGVGAGLFLAPEPIPAPDATSDDTTADPSLPAAPAPLALPQEREFARLNNQFIVPVVEDGAIASLVVMSLSLEVASGARDAVFATEPKLRDRFLQVMFDHANTGGFSGNFTAGPNMRALRNSLLEAAQDVNGARVSDVLIIDIVRQDS